VQRQTNSTNRVARDVAVSAPVVAWSWSAIPAFEFVCVRCPGRVFVNPTAGAACAHWACSRSRQAGCTLTCSLLPKVVSLANDVSGYWSAKPARRRLMDSDNRRSPGRSSPASISTRRNRAAGAASSLAGTRMPAKPNHACDLVIGMVPGEFPGSILHQPAKAGRFIARLICEALAHSQPGESGSGRRHDAHECASVELDLGIRSQRRAHLQVGSFLSPNHQRHEDPIHGSECGAACLVCAARSARRQDVRPAPQAQETRSFSACLVQRREEPVFCRFPLLPFKSWSGDLARSRERR